MATKRQQKLTPLQERFVKEYMIDLNASQAYQRAGYKSTGNSAEAAASALLRNCKVKTAIDVERNKRSESTGITAESALETLREYTLICMGKKPTKKAIKTMDGEIVEVEVMEFDSAGAGRGIDMLMKHVGAYEKDKPQDANALFIAGIRAFITPEPTLPRDRERLLNDR